MKKLLNCLINEIKMYKEVEAVVLFGSYAKNRATPISDIDICVITKRASERIKANISALGNEKTQIVFWEELHLPLRFRILKEGKFLYIKNKTFIDSIKAETLSRFLDFKPVLDNYYRKVYGWKYEI